jgi:hypothetical protein
VSAVDEYEMQRTLIERAHPRFEHGAKGVFWRGAQPRRADRGDLRMHRRRSLRRPRRGVMVKSALDEVRLELGLEALRARVSDSPRAGKTGRAHP